MGYKRVQKDKAKERNLVAKHARKYNKGGAMLDRRAAQKRGAVKHKGNLGQEES
tara:strand:- start:1998 stop:2159 length:162 start_codon:yes stop_codon:yes gene_type:complete